LLGQCGECHEWLLREEAASSDTGQLAHVHHVGTSAFSGRTYLISALSLCTASQLRLEPSEFRGKYAGPLVAVVEAWAYKRPEDPSVVALASEVVAKMGIRVNKAWSVPSPRQSLDAVLIEGPRRLLAPPRRYVYFLDRA